MIAAALAAAVLHATSPLPVDRAAGRRGAAFLKAQAPGSELGVEADTVVALVSAGVEPGVHLTRLRALVPAGAQSPGAAAKAALAAEAAGANPRCFAGVDLVARIRSGYGEGVYGASVFDDSLAITALAGADEPVPAAALSALRRLRGTGGYGLSLAGVGRDDPDTTGMALMALRAAGAPRSDPAVRGAVRWLLAQRLPGAGWAGAAGNLDGRQLDRPRAARPDGCRCGMACGRCAGAAPAAGTGRWLRRHPGRPRQSPARHARLRSGIAGGDVARRPPHDSRQALRVAILFAAGRAAAGALATGRSRKVRTPKGRVLGNSQAEKSDGQCNRKDTAQATRKGRR